MRFAVQLNAMSPFNKKRPVRPDEWGFYDPDKAGLAAVLERLAARRGLRRGEKTASAVVSPREAEPQFSSDPQ